MKIFEEGESAKSAEITSRTIELLERNSLVEFDNEEALTRLKEAIEFAEPLRQFEFPEDVKPMYTVLEDETLRLRDDDITEGNCKQDILKNASKLAEEDYFVAPPGNIPITIDENKLDKNSK